MGDTCKVGIIMKKLQGSDRKQNRRLMANRAKRVHAPFAHGQQRRKGALVADVHWLTRRRVACEKD